MNKPHGIIVFGANGSGKTTLGRELARILNFKRMDHEDYAFFESEIPYTRPRSYDECVEFMLIDIKKCRGFVISAVTGNFGDEIVSLYDLAVFINAPIDLRMERIKKRAYNQYGARVLKGGDMYEQHLKFVDFAASRPLSKIEQWAETLTCPVVRINGTEDWRMNAVNIAKQFHDLDGVRL